MLMIVGMLNYIVTEQDKMKTFNTYSRREIESIVAEKLRKELDFIYEELKRLRVKIVDLERLKNA